MHYIYKKYDPSLSVKIGGLHQIQKFDSNPILTVTVVHRLPYCPIKLDIWAKNVRTSMHRVVMIQYPDTQYPDCFDIRAFCIHEYLV